MGGAYVNRFGRKPGRGLRPWLLIPKVIAVAAGFGGTAAAWVAFLRFDSGPRDRVIQQARLIADLIDWLVYPSVAAAVVLGVALLALHGRPLWRMRWLWMKVGLVMLVMPWPVRYVRVQVDGLIHADPATHGSSPAAAVAAGQGGLAVALALWVVVIVLGRHKPRLGQRPRPMKRSGT